MKIERRLIDRIFKKNIGEDVKRVKEYLGGHINRIYEVNGKFILKVYNEDWKAEKEKYIYSLIREKTDVPVPIVLATDSGKRIIKSTYSIFSKIEGKQITKDSKLIKKAGEYLAKIHSVKFPNYGWIVKDKVKPGFSSWRNFFWYDVNEKLEKLRKVGVIKSAENDIKECFRHYDYLLKVGDKPCLLHKDYHGSHIFTKGNEITGIIDVEWSIAGHNENDFTKAFLWMLNEKTKKIFLEGYRKYGTLSQDFNKRMMLYELWHRLNMVNISFETKNNKWLGYNLKALKKCANEHH